MVFIGNHFKWHAFDLKYCISIEPDSFENLSKNYTSVDKRIGLERRGMSVQQNLLMINIWILRIFVILFIQLLLFWNQRIKQNKRPTVIVLFFYMIQRRIGTDIPNRVKSSEYKPSYYGLKP